MYGATEGIQLWGWAVWTACNVVEVVVETEETNYRPYCGCTMIDIFGRSWSTIFGARKRNVPCTVSSTHGILYLDGRTRVWFRENGFWKPLNLCWCTLVSSLKIYCYGVESSLNQKKFRSEGIKEMLSSCPKNLRHRFLGTYFVAFSSTDHCVQNCRKRLRGLKRSRLWR